MNLYATIPEIAQMLSGRTRMQDDDRDLLERVHNAVCRKVDEHCNRQFYEETATRHFDGQGGIAMWVPDLTAITALAFDEDADAVYEVELVEGTDFELIRYGHRFPYDTLPKTMIVLKPTSPTVSAFPLDANSVEIEAVWGYPVTREILGCSVAADQDDSQLTVTLDDARRVARGMSIEIGTEQQYVRDVNGQVATVARAQNGTTIAEHLTDAAVSRLRHADEAHTASLIQTARLWTRRQSGFASDILLNPVSGAISLTRGLDADVIEILRELRRLDG